MSYGAALMAVAPTWPLQQRCLSTLLVISLLVAVSPISCTSVEETETPPLKATRLCLSNQSSALLRFKHSIHSFLQPGKLTSWRRNGSDCCNWEGVTCGSLTGFIIALKIPSVIDGYSGNIASSLFELKHLQHLDLSWNSFTGTIPKRLVELAHLTHLDLSWCSFSGQVPVELSQMTRLISLNLSGNHALQLQKPNFTALVRGLAQLQHLQLNEVRISMRGRDVSSALSSSSLQKLQTLSLSYCNISSPLDDKLDLHLQSLLHLNLGGNNLQRVPKFLENLTSLNDLDLSDCGLQGKFPESIFLLPKLETMDLSYNEELVVSLPTKNLTRSANIRYLILSSIKKLFDDLMMPSPPQPRLDIESNGAKQSVLSFCSSNGISLRNLSSNTPPGTLLQGLCSFTYLTYLEIHNSSLYGTVPTCLFSLSSLQKVDLSENSLSGTISMYLSSLSSLQELDLSKNSLNGIDPMCLFSASSLEWLDLSYNCLSGSIPSSLFTFPSLRSLNLGYNRLNESLPELYNPISNLEELYLNDNLLSGDVPSFMKNLPSLQLVFLSSNDFTGMINVSLFLSLKGLVHLDVSNNKRLKAEFSHPNNHTHDTFMNLSPLQLLNFSSCNIQSFPRFICHFQRLQQLDLSYNNIEGKIPSCLWSICGLENLVLDQNKLDGFQKPVNITGSIDSKSGFSLTTSSNQIKGLIPAFLSNFTGLGFAYLDMSNNSLTGAIPNCIYKMNGVKLRRNHLQGQLPSGIFEELELLDLEWQFSDGQNSKVALL